MRTRTLAITMTLVVVTALAGASIGTVGAGTATGTLDSSSNNDATEISECQVIDESGHYDLTADLSTNSTCLRVKAGNVTIDGNGHAITGTDDDANAVFVRASSDPDEFQPTNDVTVSNLTVEHAGVVWESSDRGTLENATLLDAEVDLGSMSQGTVVESRLNQSSIEAGLGADNLTIRNNTLVESTVGLGSDVRDSVVSGNDGMHGRVYIHNSDNVTVRDNELEEVYLNAVTNVTIADNRPDDGGRFGVWIASSGSNNVVVTGNTITGNTEDAGRSVGIKATTIHNLTVTNNEIVGNEVGIDVVEVVPRSETYVGECGDELSRTVQGSVEVHQNDLSNNSLYGIQNRDDSGAIVQATNNYWGANGPSSGGPGGPLEDPKTGTLADGDGSAVSPNPNDQDVSNVRFDPWLDQDPTDDESSDESSN